MTAPFERALREELLRVARRGQRRRRRTVRSAIAAALAAIAGLLAVTLPGNRAAAEVRVTVENDVLEVELTESTSSPQEVVRALRDHGVEAVVEAVPTGPSSVGRFVRIVVEEQAGSPVTVTYLEPSGSGHLAFRVPADWPGQMTISFGRPARPGEAYDGPTDALLPGEPLHCSGIRGSTLADAVDAVDAVRGLTARVEVHEGVELGRQLTLSEALTTEYRAWYVSGAVAVSERSVILDVRSRPVGDGDPAC